jgi:hypothetical protein
MSNTPTHCPTCGAELPDRGFYCPSCSAQARCQTCRELLEPGARACVECGTLVGDGATTGTDSRQREAAAPNRIRLEETRTSRSLDVSVTDAAVEHLSEPLSAFLAGGLREVQGSRRRHDRQMGGPLAEQLPLVAGDDEAIEVSGSVVPSRSAVILPAGSSGDWDRLRRIFKHEGEKIVLMDPRLKADTKVEYVGRLTCLYLYAHDLEGRPRVARALLKDMLEERGLWAADTRRWLGNTDDVVVSDGDMIELSVPGKERAIESLDRIENHDIPQGRFSPGAGSKPRAAKSEAGAATEDDGGTKSRKRADALSSKKIEPWVARWNATGITVEAYKVLKDRSNAEKGLFGLWAIRKAIGDAGRVVTRVQLAQFLYQAFEIKVDDATLAKALKTPAVKDLVMHVGGTKFQVKPEGMDAVDRMVAQQSSPSSPSLVAPAAVNGASPVGQS